MTVADAPPEAVSVAGLTTQVGKKLLVIATVGVTVHPSVTGPTNPEPATIVRFAEDVPPGAVASGLMEPGAVKVKSGCAKAAGTNTSAAHAQASTNPARLLRSIHFEVNPSILNMSRLVSNTFDSWDVEKAARATFRFSPTHTSVQAKNWFPRNLPYYHSRVEIGVAGFRKSSWIVGGMGT